MDGIHDLGGRQGFGRVRFTQGATAFHAPWEVRANSLYAHAVRIGLFNMDEYRHAIERMDPRHYLTASYYERSLTSLITLCVEKGVVPAEELERRAGGAIPLATPSALGRGNSVAREQFKPGDAVRVKLDSVPGHMRMPGYIRGKAGIVVSETPAYPFPDAHAHGVASEDEPTYDVRFRSEDLWPGSAEPAHVHVGVFQSYLERA
ncbi:MAG TPA: nitrile hydratase subunit beta [Usitatibacter sp.]|jgi:nitrile hydratase|nr:nitrile hydratase subunit beta [Usitatibacter sp.]